MEIESLREQQDEGSISLTELAENFHRLDTSILQQIPQNVLMIFFLPLIVLVDLPYQQKLNRNFLQISLLFLEKKP